MSDELTLSRADLARLLGVTPPVITTAVDEGAPGVVDRGGPGRPATIRVAPFLAWWIERAVRRGGGVGGKLIDVDRGLDIELKREKLAVARREYVPRATLTEVTRDAFTRLRVSAERLESRYAHRFVLLADQTEAAAALAAVAREMLGELRTSAFWEAPATDALDPELEPDPAPTDDACDDVASEAA